MSHKPLRARLGCESLELRDVPAVLFSESFETSRPPSLTPGWASWGTGTFNTNRIVATDGAVSVASNGNETTETRLFSTTPQPGDAPVSVRVYSDSPTPVAVFARGQNLATERGSFIGVQVRNNGMQIDLIEFKNSTTTILATLQNPTPVHGAWIDVTVKPLGTKLSASIQRIDTGEFLSAAGVWQSQNVDALQTNVAAFTGNGSFGIARMPGGAGSVFFDQFEVLPVPVLEPIRENFDSTTPGTTPATWQNYTSDKSTGFTTTTSRPFSTPNGYTVTGGSTTTSRSWYTTAQASDVQVSASLYADSLIPATLFSRGQQLDSAKPTYYGLTVTRGVQASITRVVNGTETVLATVKSTSYVSSVWLRISLFTSGTTLRAVINRADTNQWLTPDGSWSDVPQPAIELQDKLIPTGGFVGLQRNALTAGAITFDNFEIRQASANSGPAISLTASQTGTIYSNTVTFTATDSTSSARRVEFRLNGKLRAATQSAPATWTLDTTLLANGPQELVVRALDDLGNPTTVTLKFTTSNANVTAAPVRPELPQKLSHIRIAQLAYSSNPMGTFEQTQLANTVDLVVANPKFLGTIDNVASSTTSIVYTNISNLYQGLLTDWLTYADANKIDREAAFYHVASPSTFTGSSPSSQPVTWLWGVYRDATDLTAASTGGRSTGVEFGGVNSNLSLGYTEKFAELNFNLSKPASASWQSVVEYVSAVDAGGKPTAWKTLKLNSDSSQGLTRSGRWTFDPPSDWVTSSVNGSDRLYYLRVRTTAGGTAPVATTILGRDYVNANGKEAGTIPVFDYTADANRDGYLSEAEYAKRSAGKDARFSYESRLFYPYYGQMRFASNPSNAGFAKWAAAYHQKLLTAMPLAEGFFLDNANGKVPTGEAKVIEPTDTYAEDIGVVVGAITRVVSPKILIANTAGGNASATPTAAASTGVFEEFALRPTEASWASFNDLASLVESRLAADSPSPYVILDSLPGSFDLKSDRVKMGTLAYYYLLSDPKKTFLTFYGGFSPSAAWADTWIKAAETNVGQPTGSFTTFAKGQDPENKALEYRVFKRDYGNAMVLYKPRSYNQGVGTGTARDATATTHQLGGRYRVLNADGSQGPVVTQITLRNGEGAVLMKA
jgi:hypothetical protein